MPIFRRSEEQLHRIQDNKNDWDDVPDQDLSTEQRIAKRTKGIATVANAISLFGTYLVVKGVHDVTQGHKLKGFFEIVGGRLCDLADGNYAAKHEVKGRFGRDLDPTLDGVQIVLSSLILAKADVLPPATAALMVGQKMVETAAAVSGKMNNVVINPEGEGKVGTFAQWTGITAFVLESALGDRVPETVGARLEAIGWLGTIGGSAYKAPATAAYVQQGFQLAGPSWDHATTGNPSA